MNPKLALKRTQGTITRVPSSTIRCIKAVSAESPILISNSKSHPRPPTAALVRPQRGLSRRRLGMLNGVGFSPQIQKLTSLVTCPVAKTYNLNQTRDASSYLGLLLLC